MPVVALKLKSGVLPPCHCLFCSCAFTIASRQSQTRSLVQFFCYLLLETILPADMWEGSVGISPCGHMEGVALNGTNGSPLASTYLTPFWHATLLRIDPCMCCCSPNAIATPQSTGSFRLNVTPIPFVPLWNRILCSRHSKALVCNGHHSTRFACPRT